MQLKDAKVPVHLQQRLATVTKDGARIVEIVMEDGTRYRAKVFIDCSYEGDLMAKAGVSYLVGREGNERFGETINGIRERPPQHQFSVAVDPYLTPGDPKSGLLPLRAGRLLSARPARATRPCRPTTFGFASRESPENRRPIEPPPGYDPKRYELLGRYCQALAAAGRNR